MKSKELGRLRRIAEQLAKLQQELNATAEHDRKAYYKRPVTVRKSTIGHAQWERFTSIERAADAIGSAVSRLDDVTEVAEKLCARCKPDKVCAKCRAFLHRQVREAFT